MTWEPSKAYKDFAYIASAVAENSVGNCRVSLPTQTFLDFFQEFCEMRVRLRDLEEWIEFAKSKIVASIPRPVSGQEGQPS